MELDCMNDGICMGLMVIVFRFLMRVHLVQYFLYSTLRGEFELHARASGGTACVGAFTLSF